ncbi:MAG TPA: 2Fe-2S iron-sulfur cluster-binding protein, partial [Bacteroidota bacterium]|nr:2Fe-2S iron-sulfur cluster-binding protein [Bacteroidota bacterium]
MAILTLSINGSRHTVDVSPDTTLLWVLRDTLGLTGTKFGCGQGLCGSCIVLINDKPVRSCVTAVGSVAGADILTIEGL